MNAFSKTTTLGDRLRIARQNDGRSIENMAEIMDMECTEIEKLEADAYPLANIPVQRINKLAEIFNVEARWLTHGEISEDTNLAANASIHAGHFLRAAADHLENRASQRDCEDGERSMAKTVNAFNAMFNKNITEVQGWQFMELLKMARSTNGSFVLDDFEDGAAYCALAGEAASKVA